MRFDWKGIAQKASLNFLIETTNANIQACFEEKATMASIIQVSVSIGETTPKVWDLFMDHQNLRHWLTGFISVKTLTGEAGQPGSTSAMEFLEGAKRLAITETVLQSERYKQFAFRMEHQSGRSDNDVRFISFGRRTELIQTTMVFPNSFVMKMLLPIVKGQMKKQMAKELSRFKYFVETSAPVKL